MTMTSGRWTRPSRRSKHSRADEWSLVIATSLAMRVWCTPSTNVAVSSLGRSGRGIPDPEFGATDRPVCRYARGVAATLAALKGLVGPPQMGRSGTFTGHAGSWPESPPGGWQLAHLAIKQPVGRPLFRGGP